MVTIWSSVDAEKYNACNHPDVGGKTDPNVQPIEIHFMASVVSVGASALPASAPARPENEKEALDGWEDGLGRSHPRPL